MQWNEHSDWFDKSFIAVAKPKNPSTLFFWDLSVEKKKDVLEGVKRCW